VPKEINTVKALAPPQNIHAAIPEEGIEIQELARKFGVDSSNFHLFVELLKKIAILEVSAIVKPAKSLPSPSELEELEIAAKEPPIPRVLKKNQTVLSKLLGAPVV
jgi:transposase-like protein